MSFKEEPDLLEIRGMIYSFLSSSFLYSPNSDQVKTMIEQQLFEEFPLKIDREEFSQGLTLLRFWAKESENQELDDVLTQLLEDYSNLFIGPGHLLAPPWESVYLTEERLTFGEPTIEIREFYLRHGLEYTKKNSEPDDHFGLEMEFMSKLITKQIQELQCGQVEETDRLEREQLLFLEKHVMKWVNEFTDDVFNHSNSPFFKGLALLTRGYIAWDYDQLFQQPLCN